MESNKDYHISFFKPTTPTAKRNRDLTLILISIWVVAIFGFQVALRIFEKPTPEPAYTQFENVWNQVQNGNASQTDLQNFAQSNISVLGKLFFLKAEHKQALNNALSWSVNELIPHQERDSIQQIIKNFEKTQASVSNIQDKEYLKAKQEIIEIVAPIIGLPTNDIRANLVPMELISSNMDKFKAKHKAAIPEIMATYLIHNQSFLTDFNFLGFPFHYFYAAIFLLILFIFLCWLYCVRIDRMNAQLGIEE